MRYLSLLITLFGFFIQTNSIYANTAEANSFNTQTNLCHLLWWKTATTNDKRNELNKNIFDVKRPCDDTTLNTPLHWAIMAGAGLEEVTALVNDGADVLAKNATGASAIYLASWHSSEEVYQYLLNASTQTRQFQTVLLEAAINSLVEEEISDRVSFRDNHTQTSFDDVVHQQIHEHFQEIYNRSMQTLRNNFQSYFQSYQNSIEEDYYQDILDHWQLERERMNRYVDDVNEQHRAYQDPWHRNAPVGFYASFDAGTVLKSMFTQHSFTNDVPTNCDQFLNGKFQHPLTHVNCTSYPGGRWDTDFETQVGLTVGAIFGYAWAADDDPFRFRIEGEFTRRQIGGNTALAPTTHSDKISEFQFTRQSFSDLNINQYFVNFYLDFPKLFENAGDGWRNIIPYGGLGVGNVDPNLQHTSLWYRHKDPKVLSAQGVNPDAAGALSFGDFQMESDNSPGIQFLFGADYPLTSRVQLGLKARYTKFYEDFTSSSHWWTLLRSHESRRFPNGTPVTYDARIDDMDFFDITLQLKVYFGRRGRRN